MIHVCIRMCPVSPVMDIPFFSLKTHYYYDLLHTNPGYIEFGVPPADALAGLKQCYLLYMAQEPDVAHFCFTTFLIPNYQNHYPLLELALCHSWSSYSLQY